MDLVLVFLEVKFLLYPTPCQTHWKAPISALGEESNIMNIKENVHYRKEEMPGGWGIRRITHNLY